MSDRALRARVRETRLRELGYDTYAAYLRSPAWRDVRERYKASDLPQVCMCGATTWQLHHTTYERVGREQLDDLVPLCQDCHTQAHVLEAEGVIDLDLKGFYFDVRRARENAIVEDARKAQARADFDDPEHAPVDPHSRWVERKRQRGRNRKVHAAMLAAADPEAVAKRRARIVAEGNARYEEKVERERRAEENRQAAAQDGEQ